MGRGASPLANPCSFVRKHHVCRAGWAFGGWDVVLHRPQTLIPLSGDTTSAVRMGRKRRWDVVLHHPQALIPSSGGTTSVGPDGPSAAGTWYFTTRKPLFLRPEAPRLSGRMGRRRLERGTSLPANPCSFVRRHHVCRAGWASGGGGVVLHRPQALIPSSEGTTSFSSRAAARDGAWYLTARKPLFLRPETPRLGSGWAFGGWDVVLHHPQTLVPSSGSTTSIGSDGPSAAGTWCFTAHKPLFLRPETPRLSGRMGLRRRRRGASPPASPYSFVRRHHVFQL